MNIRRTILFSLQGKTEEISIGIPETPDELRSMFALRYQEYTRHDYIHAENSADGIEKDEYDENGKSTYFIAVWQGKTIGTIRLIQDTPLPTEKAFGFAEPKDIASIAPEQRAEFGRFVIIPLDREKKIYQPRGLVMLGMFDALLEHCTTHNISGGYAFVKTTLAKKLERVKAPVHLIEPYKQQYPPSGVLYKYFTQANNPVIPIYFLTEEFRMYLEKKLTNTWLFKKTDSGIEMKDNLFSRSLQFLNLV